MVDALLRFRDDFPILASTTYLVSNSLGAMPRSVPDRLAEYAREWATRGVRAWAEGWWEMPVSVGDAIAPLIGAGAREVAMVPNVSMAQAQVFSALDYSGTRDTIVMTALVTSLGLLPLALGSGRAGREIEGPMAAVILGGLVTSTLLNLLVLPSLALRYGRFE